MPLPTVYTTGTASVANGATTVTLVGAVSGAIYAGDLFCDPAQPLVPPQRIATDPVAGVFSLAVAWPGTSMSAADYEVRITPDSARVQERTREVLNALGSLVAADVPFTPAGSIAAGDLQAAIEELDAEKQPLDADLTALATAFTAAGSGAQAKLQLAENTTNGTNKVTVQAPAAITSDRTFTLPDATVTMGAFIATLLNSTTAAGAQAAIGVREVLTANRTYYVRTDGSDSNNGLANTAGGAFLTIQKAMTVAASLDCSTFNLTVQVGAGTYTTFFALPKMTGSGTFTLLGNAATPASCIISITSNACVSGVDTFSAWTINGFKLQTTTGGNCLSMAGSGRIRFLNLDFGTCAGTHHIVSSGPGAVIEAAGNWTISGNSAYTHMTTSYGAQILAYSKTITLSGTRAFTIFALSQGVSSIDSGSLTFSGSATGSRYQASTNGIINVSGGGANYFPGNVVGMVVTGGQYS